MKFAYHERQAARAHSLVPGQVLLFTLRKMSREVPKAAAKQTVKGDSPATGVKQTDNEGQQSVSDMPEMCWVVRSVNIIIKKRGKEHLMMFNSILPLSYLLNFLCMYFPTLFETFLEPPHEACCLEPSTVGCLSCGGHPWGDSRRQAKAQAQQGATKFQRCVVL